MTDKSWEIRTGNSVCACTPKYAFHICMAVLYLQVDITIAVGVRILGV
jgi:hypothetical protein